MFVVDALLQRAEESTIHPVDSGGLDRLVDSVVDWWTGGLR